MTDHIKAQVAPTLSSHITPPEKKAVSFSSPSSEHGTPSPSSSISGRRHHGERWTMDGERHTTSLAATFLHHDIHPQDGHRLLLPFLTTMDRLRLSECSQGLIEYRYSLNKVKVVPHPSPTPANKRGLARLLFDQRYPGGLEYLRVGDRSVLSVLDLASWGCFEGLKTLDLAYVRVEKDGEEEEEEEEEEFGVLDEEDVEHVTMALKGGGLGGLEELMLRGSALGVEGFEAITGCLEVGVCPRLRRLSLIHGLVWQDDGFGFAMAEALESGQLRNIRSLELYNVNPGERGGSAITRALRGGACPRLVKLNFDMSHLSRDALQVLGEAMSSGLCSKLEDLNLRHVQYHDDGFMAIFGALEASSCPLLKQLNLDGTKLPVASATTLAHALRSGGCHGLQLLALGSGVASPDASLHVLQAIQQGGRGAVPNLLALDMKITYMDQEHGRVLGEAIGERALPKLEELGLKRNPLGDDGVVPIMVGLEKEGCHHLKTLDVECVTMGPQGGHALTQALASGHLSCLQSLSVANNRPGDEAMTEVIMRLRECHQLRQLNVSGTEMGGMAGQALIQALQDKVWPDLEALNASYNKRLISEEGVKLSLVEVLEGRTGLYRRLKRVDFRATGMEEEGEVGARLVRLLAKFEEWKVRGVGR